MRTNRLLGAAVAASVVLVSQSTYADDRVVIQNKGSDTLVNVAQAWAEAYPEVNPKVAVAVSSSNAPRFDVNPNNGGPLFNEDPPVVAQQTVYRDAQRPSAMILPVIPLP